MYYLQWNENQKTNEHIKIEKLKNEWKERIYNLWTIGIEAIVVSTIIALSIALSNKSKMDKEIVDEVVKKIIQSTK